MQYRAKGRQADPEAIAKDLFGRLLKRFLMGWRKTVTIIKS